MKHGEDPIQQLIAEQAAEWFVAHQAGELTVAERARFAAWLRSSPTHVGEYLAIATLSGELSELTADALFATIEMDHAMRDHTDDKVVWLHDQTDVTQAKLRWSWGRWLAVGTSAATLLVAVVATLWLTPWFQSSRGSEQIYQTAQGEQRSVLLPDGSVLYLNSDTRIKVDYVAHGRELQLERGQALFEVAHDKTRPFRVLAGVVATVAVGTQFDVYRRGSATVVTVVEGTVAVQTPGTPSSAADAQAARITMQLTAGHQAEVNAAMQLRTSEVNAQHAIAWTRHQIVFERERLANIAAEFSRYSVIPLEVDDLKLRELQLSGVFDSYDMPSFVEFLKRLADVEVVTTTERVLVRPRRYRAESQQQPVAQTLDHAAR